MPGYISDHIIFAKTMPADSNKAMMFYMHASKLEQGVATVDKSAEDTGTGKAPLIRGC